MHLIVWLVYLRCLNVIVRHFFVFALCNDRVKNMYIYNVFGQWFSTFLVLWTFFMIKLKTVAPFIPDLDAIYFFSTIDYCLTMHNVCIVEMYNITTSCFIFSYCAVSTRQIFKGIQVRRSCHWEKENCFDFQGRTFRTTSKLQF